ncbi:hypothetical protein BKA57DRAFT_434565 [Linnemannia elongata]|nr:hypothetical protein BKA57DRAFT_434565 [Linnemannia elongata]
MSQPSSSSSSPSSSSTPTFASKDDEIAFLRRTLERVDRYIDDRLNTSNDQAVKTQSALQIYYPTDDQAKIFPQIKPEPAIDFFTKTTFTEAEYTKNIREFPKNFYMDGYKAPKVPQIVTKNLSFSNKHDGQIRDFQERCAEITRPIDFFFHEFYKLQETNKENPDKVNHAAVLDIAVDFAILMRRHVGSLANKMHEARMANVRAAAGATIEDDPLRMPSSIRLRQIERKQRRVGRWKREGNK